MKKLSAILMAIIMTGNVYLLAQSDPTIDPIQSAVTNYFDQLFGQLKKAADQNPEKDTFREIMKPLVEDIDGLYGATLIGTNFVIKQVYFSRNFLARGFDLKKVDQLTEFYRQMQEKPAPQLSEPGHGSLLQPALVAMRYPVIKDGEFVNIVSMMIRTEYFLEAVGLDKVKAYEIVCLGTLAEKEGELSDNPQVLTIKLPSTEWVIKYSN